MDYAARSAAEYNLVSEIFARYPYLQLWIAENGTRRLFGLVIALPKNIRDEWHRIVHDNEFRERARSIIHPQRVNEPGDNAVLTLMPIQ